MTIIPKGELEQRINRLRSELTGFDAEWKTAVLMDRINCYYLTGTMQNGVLVIKRDGDAVFYVRRSCQRAIEESNFPDVRCFKSFRELEIESGGILHLDTEKIPMAHFSRFSKYHSFDEIRSLDFPVAKARAVKSELELSFMKQAGEIHRSVLEEYVPSILEVGMSEFELGTEILSEMMRRGSQGLTRTGGYGSELFLGLVCFGESALYHNTFDGPGGVRGISTAVPLMGSSEVKLERNMPVFVDVACGIQGYYTDKTSIYSIGELTDEACRYHEICVQLQQRGADMLRPGAVPSEIYREHTAGVDAEFLKEYNGFGLGKVTFLGHGIGLHVDEYPVIAEKFDDPLEENMVIALEPKRGIPGLGMVGIENTFVVTPEGGKSLTGSHFDIISKG